ncbi:MAG: helix-turn-helix domain-containing protein [Acidilobaceae archaeon]
MASARALALVALAAVLAVALAVYKLGGVAGAASPLLLIPLDSCSFEVSRELVERGLVEGLVVHPASLTPEGLSDARVVLLAAYQPEREMLEWVLGRLEESQARVYASSNILSVTSKRLVHSSDLRAWCEEGSEEALVRVSEALRDDGVNPATFAIPLALVAIVAVTVAASGAASSLWERLREAPLVIAILALKLRKRGRLDESEVLAHPLRASIIGILRESPASFAELQSKLGVSRAVLEWHLGVLRAYGVVVEERNGRSRVYRLSNE